MKSDLLDLPNWEQVRLEDISLDFVSGGTPSTSKAQYWDGEIHWMRSAHISNKEVLSGEKHITQTGLENSATNIVPKDNLLITTRVSLGNVAINRVDMAISQDLTGIILNKEKIDENFLYYLLKTKENKILSIAQGTTIKGILRDDLRKIRISLPPLVEQRGIVEVLGTVDECIRLTDAVIKRAEELKRGLMQRLLTRGIGHTEYKETSLGKIPKTWKIEKLGNVLQLCEYGLSYSLSREGKYPVFRMNNLENGYVIENNLKFVNLNDNEFQKYKLHKGDILFNRTNSYDLVGKVGIYLLEGVHTFASYLIRLQTKPKLDPKFLNFFMNVEQSQNNLRRLATRGVSQSNINAQSLKSLEILLPPIHEQLKIIEMLENQDNVIGHEIKKKKHLNLVKQGLIQVLLSGKTRVELKGDGLHRIGDRREANN